MVNWLMQTGPFLMSFMLALWPSSHARAASQKPVQIIQASDLHSQYDHSVDFILAITRLQQKFRQENPNGVSLLLLNGDISGPSEWTDLDKGGAIYETLSYLSNVFDGFGMTPGNHDGWSFTANSAQDGNDLYDQQSREALRLFRQNSRHSGQQIVANIEVNPKYADYYRPSVDFDLGGEPLRVIGLVADDLFNHSSYDPTLTPNPILRILPALEAAKQQMQIAAQDGIHQIIFMDHEGHRVIRDKILPQLLEWKKNNTDPRIRDMNIPVFFAAHTHLEVKTAVENVPLIESGSRYKFSEVILNSEGQLQSHHLYDYSEQEKLAHRNYLPEATRKALGVMEPLVQEMRTINDQVIFESEGILVTRKDLRVGPHWLGQALANSLRASALRLRKNRKFKVDDVFGLFASTAFRRDEGLPAGPVTFGELKSFHPLPKDVAYGIMDGETLRKFIVSFRQQLAQSGDFSPQTSTNLIVPAEGPILVQEVRRELRETPLQRELNDRGTYLVAMDGFMGTLVRRNQEWSNWAQNIQWVKTYGRYSQTTILATEFPNAYAQPDILRIRARSCARIHFH